MGYYISMGAHSLYILTISVLTCAFLYSIGTFQRIYPLSNRPISELLFTFQMSGWDDLIGKGYDSHSQTVHSEFIEAIRLLQIGDAWGAEIICQSLSNSLNTTSSKTHRIEQGETSKNRQQNPSSVDILICLGEAQLLFHQQSYNSIMNRFARKQTELISSDALINTQIQSSLDKLHSARLNFESAVLLEPTNPRARGDLGLTLLLLGTRSFGFLNEEDQPSQRVSIRSTMDLLFDASLHLSAAATLIESWIDDELHKDTSAIPKFHTRDKTMHVTALYNGALAHLAMGDHKAASRLLRRVHDLLSYEAMSKPYDGHNRMVSIPLVNLFGTLIQLGQTFEALDLLLEMDRFGYCSSQEINDTTVDRMTLINQNSEEDRLTKICMILLNNRDVVIEWKYMAGVNMTATDNSSVHLDKLYEISSQLSDIFAHSHEMAYWLEFAKVNRDQLTKTSSGIDDNQKQLTMSIPFSSNPTYRDNLSKPSVKNALDSLEKAASLDPGNSRMLLTLTRAKMVTGDNMGAVEAATKAINAAQGLEEIEFSTRILEQALERLVDDEKKREFIEATAFHGTITPRDDITINEDKTNDRQPNEAEMESLRLERDVLALKLELLEHEVQTLSLRIASKPNLINREYEEAPANSLNESIYEEDQVTQLDSLQPNSASLDKPLDEYPTPSNSSGSNAPDAETAKSESVIEMVQSDIHEPHALTTNSTYTELETRDNNITFSYKEELNNLFNESSKFSDTNYTSTSANHGDIQDEIKIELPVLFKPDILSSSDISPIALSYMKIADAHMEKDQFQQATKQFAKVLKRHPDHLPALLGYATAYERSSNQNQLEDVSIAYLHAAQVALQRGAYDLADAVMRRAIDVSKPMNKQKRLGVLKQIFNYSHTDDIAAEISFEIGRLATSNNDNLKEARHSFHLANALIVRKTGNSTACHAPSSLEMGKIALDIDYDYKRAMVFIENALAMDHRESHIEGLVVLGRAKAMAGDLVAAKAAFVEAVDKPTAEYSAQAHYHLGLLLLKDGGESETIEKHFVAALNLGLDVTAEIIEVLGEYNVAVLKSINKAKRREYENALAKDSRGGGVLGGTTLSDKSIFQKPQENPSSRSETLSILEQGAASYDGQNVPDGEETGDNHSGNLPKTRRSQHVIT